MYYETKYSDNSTQPCCQTTTRMTLYDQTVKDIWCPIDGIIFLVSSLTLDMMNLAADYFVEFPTTATMLGAQQRAPPAASTVAKI